MITCDNWFVAPDGHSYLAVWGDCETVTAESALGLVPNRNSANWFVKVSNNGEEMIVAGCQIHYAASCPERPNTDATEQNFDDRGRTVRDGKIYIPGEVLGKPEPEKMMPLPPRMGNDRIYIRDLNQSNADFIANFYREEINIREDINIFDSILGDTEKKEIKMLLTRIGSREDKRNISRISIFECHKIIVEFSDRSHFETYLLPF